MTEEIKDAEMVADEAAAAAAEDKAGTQKLDAEPHQQEKKYTDDDVDRIVSRKLSAQKKRLQKAFEDEHTLSELEQREKNVLMRELKADAKDMLIDRGLPSALAQLLDYSDKDAMSHSLDDVESIFNSSVEQAVKARLRGTPPRRSAGSLKNGEKALHDAFLP